MDDTGREPRYQIGVAAGMLDCHPQTLRMYEREGLIAASDSTATRTSRNCDASRA
jgi:DNA-binding transcriptional MerR regulator